MSTFDTIEEQVANLVHEGREMLKKLSPEEEGKQPTQREYQRWYTPCRRLLEALDPGRLEDFESCYDCVGSGDVRAGTYRINQYLLGQDRPEHDQLKLGADIAASRQARFSSYLEKQIAILETLRDWRQLDVERRRRVESGLRSIELVEALTKVPSPAESPEHLGIIEVEREELVRRGAGLSVTIAVEQHLADLLDPYYPKREKLGLTALANRAHQENIFVDAKKVRDAIRGLADKRSKLAHGKDSVSETDLKQLFNTARGILKAKTYQPLNFQS